MEHWLIYIWEHGDHFSIRDVIIHTADGPGYFGLQQTDTNIELGTCWLLSELDAHNLDKSQFDLAYYIF